MTYVLASSKISDNGPWADNGTCLLAQHRSEFGFDAHAAYLPTCDHHTHTQLKPVKDAFEAFQELADFSR